jgi:ribosome-associated toxin RatA of RatAB toxin-antitoxin module
MPDIKRTQVVPYTQAQMYALVDDICSYSEFVPWCIRSEELSRDADTVQGKLTFAASGVEKSFTTLNLLQPQKMIELRLVDGPFKQLEGFWAFEVVDEAASRITLDLEFEFSSRILAMMFGPVFEQVASSLVKSFAEQAAKVYGH